VTRLDELEAELHRRERALERRIGEARSLAEEGKRLSSEYSSSKILAEVHEEAVGVLNSFADSRQEEAIRRIELLVSSGLQSIFGEGMEFAVLSEQKARRSEVQFVIRSQAGDSVVETPILDARGGGVAAVAGFLLRVIVLLLKPNARRILFLDESFAQLSVEYEDSCASFIKELVDRTGLQVVLVTHSSSQCWYEAADRIYKTSQKDGWTSVEKVL